MKYDFPGGVWPVMLTPFTEEKEVDYHALEELVEWYIESGVSGLFAVCQSSEMFFLGPEERVKICRCILKQVAGRIPVIASGHVSDDFEEQVREVNAIADTGVDAVILITNRFAKEEEGDRVWRENCEKLLARINQEIPLGFYECPYPYKRLLTPENIRWCAKTGRFFFLKDTCCDSAEISVKLNVIKGTNLKLYNANTATLLESLRAGAAGYSGVMANFHPALYVWLCTHYKEEKAEKLSDMLTMMSYIERQRYPVNAKYYLNEYGHLKLADICRVCDGMMTETEEKEVGMLERITRDLMKEYRIPYHGRKETHEHDCKGKKEKTG